MKTNVNIKIWIVITAFWAAITANAAAQEWKKIEGSLTVQQTVEIGMRENPMLRAAGADVRAAGSERHAARSQTRPQLSATTYLSTGDASNILGSAPGTMPPNLQLVPPRTFADQNLTLMVPLYTGGRLGSLVRASASKELSASADLDGLRADVALRIKEAYYRALLAAETVKAALARVDAGSAMQQVARAQFEAGKGIEASVRRVDAELSDANRAASSARNERARSLLDLKMEMGVNLDSQFELADGLKLAAPPGDLKSMLSEALRTRPELRAARARLEAAQAQTSAARGSLQPQLYGMAMADAFAARSMPGGAGYTVGVAASIPLIDGGQRRAEIGSARAMQDRSEAELRAMELKVSIEVRRAWLDLDTATQNHQSALAELQAAQAAYDVAILRVQNQKAILVEQLDALSALVRARANVAQALYEQASASARLSRAIGRS